MLRHLLTALTVRTDAVARRNRATARVSDRAVARSAAACVESLERRVCLSGAVAAGSVPWSLPKLPATPAGDADDQVAEAHALGAMTTDRSASEALSSGTDVNLYSFTVTSGQRIAFDLDRAAGATLDGYLRVFDASGNELASNDSGAAPNEGAAGADPYVQFTFPSAGTFYVGVSGSGNAAYNAVAGTGDAAGSVGASGGYTLTAAVTGGSGFVGLQADATRPTDNTTTTFTLRRFNSSGVLTTQAIDPSVRTWVVIHGFHGNGTSSGMTGLATAILAKYPSDQVVTLDWSAAAADPSYTATEQFLEPIGDATGKLLAAHGLAGTTINFVGYSFGSTIAGEAAERIAGGVNTILGIDPPLYTPLAGGGGYDPRTSLNFAANSRFSWTFHDVDPTHSGDPVTPTTADEAIDVSGTTHGEIPFLVANIIRGTNPASQRFNLDRLLAATPGPWRTDQYDDQGNLTSGGLYEAVLATTSAGSLPTTITYISAATGQSVTE